jgi:hypothetical protein
MFKFQPVILIFFLISIRSLAFQSRDEIGLGFTDNATLSSTDKRSDTYLKLSTNDSVEYRDQKIQFRGGYLDYFKVHEDDLLFWNIKDKFPLVQAWTLSAGLFGNHYLNESPGITDEAFSNVGGEAKGENQIKLGDRRRFYWGPGAEVRRYYELSTRTDNTLSAEATFEYDTSPVSVFNSFGRTAVVISNQSDYSRDYLDIGAGFDYVFKKDWSWYTDIDYKHTSFFSRVASANTITSRLRGKGSSVSKTTNTIEAYDNIQLFTKITRNFFPRWSFGCQLTLENQSSISGLETYTATNLYGFVAGYF